MRPARSPSLEAGICAIGRRELASQFADEQDEAVRNSMIEAQIFLLYRRDLNNLSIQEARLRRVFEKDEAELKRVIAERRKAADDRRHEENMRWASAIHHMKVAKEMGLPFDPKEVGFEFSVEEIIAREQQRCLQGAIKSGSYYEWKKRGLLNLPQKAA